MKNKKTIFLLSVVFIIFSFVLLKVQAFANVDDTTYNGENATVEFSNNGNAVYINNIKPGKRLVGLSYCLQSDDCDDESNWKDTHAWDTDKKPVNEFSNSVGSDDYVFWIDINNVGGVFAND